MKPAQQPDDCSLLLRLAAIHNKLLTGPSVQNRIMRAWDTARALVASGDKSDLPRSILESAIEDVLDDVEECMKLASEPEREAVDVHAGALAIRDFQETIGFDALRMAEACAEAWGLQWRKSPEERP